MNSKKTFPLYRLFNLNRPAYYFLHLILLSMSFCFICVHRYDESFNLWYQDVLVKKHYEYNKTTDSNPFLILSIDDDSYNYMLQNHGSLRIAISKLVLQLKKFIPKGVCINFLFYGKGLSAEDIYLTGAANSSLPIYFKAELTKDGHFFSPLDAISTPNPKFGFLFPNPSRDSTVRKLKIAEDIPGFGPQLDLSSQLTALIRNDSSTPSFDFSKKVLTYTRMDHSLKTIHTDNQNCISLRYYKTWKDLHVLRALDVIENKINPAIFYNKIILIEGTASVFQNSYSTPIGPLPQAGILVNSIMTQLHEQTSLKSLRIKHCLFLILGLSILFSLLNFAGSFFAAFMYSALSLFILHFLFWTFYQSGILLPYGSIIISSIIPLFYSWIGRYFNLSLQSHELIRIASTDPSTGLYNFRYFTFLLQRNFIRLKRKHSGIYLVGIQLVKKDTQEQNPSQEIESKLFREIGQFLNRYSKKAFCGYSIDQSRFFIAFTRYSAIKSTLLSELHHHLDDILKRFNQQYAPRIAGVDSEVSGISSSIHLIQILDTLLKDKYFKNTHFIEYHPSNLSTNFPEVPDPLFPQTDMDYVSLQIHEDKVDLHLMKKNLNKSIQNSTMTQKLSAMGQLSSYYAHELKNPLHNLLNCVSILEDPQETPEEKTRILALLKSELNRTIDLTNKMRNHFKPSDEKPSEVQINDLIKSTLTIFLARFKEQKIEALIESDNSIPTLFVVADQLKQVFVNLILNAIEAMPQGGHLTLSTSYTPPVVRITIEDTGIGIDAIDLERIFEVFYSTKKEKGTGMGLFACYNIIQRHGGSITAHSTKGVGSCFEIILPT